MFVRRLLTGQHKPIPVPQTHVYYYHISQLTKMVRVCYYKIINKTMNDEKLSDCCKEKIHDCPKFGKSHCVKCSKKCDVSTPPADSNLELNSNTNIEDLAEKEEWGAWKIVSDMLDNPDEYGIYPTSKCYKELYDFVCLQKEKTRIKTEEYMLKNHLSSLKSLLQQERQREREKMIEEITKKIIDEVDYVQNHSSGNYADGMVDALLKIKRDIIKNKE